MEGGDTSSAHGTASFCTCCPVGSDIFPGAAGWLPAQFVSITPRQHRSARAPGQTKDREGRAINHTRIALLRGPMRRATGAARGRVRELSPAGDGRAGAALAGCCCCATAAAMEPRSTSACSPGLHTCISYASLRARIGRQCVHIGMCVHMDTPAAPGSAAPRRPWGCLGAPRPCSTAGLGATGAPGCHGAAGHGCSRTPRPPPRRNSPAAAPPPPRPGSAPLGHRAQAPAAPHPPRSHGDREPQPCAHRPPVPPRSVAGGAAAVPAAQYGERRLRNGAREIEGSYIFMAGAGQGERGRGRRARAALRPPPPLSRPGRGGCWGCSLLPPPCPHLQPRHQCSISFSLSFPVPGMPPRVLRGSLRTTAPLH